MFVESQNQMIMPFKYLIHPFFEFLNWKSGDSIIIIHLKSMYVFYKLHTFLSYHETQILLRGETLFQILELEV